MGLFQLKPEASATLPTYTIGQTNTILVVGLGNPGKKFVGSRHNIGFEVIDDFAHRIEIESFSLKKDLAAELSTGTLGQSRLILAKPQTYINESGSTVGRLKRFFKLTNDQILVVYDELAIPFGQLRSRVGGSDAGHNGVKSIIQQIGLDFGRLRIGIGNQQADQTDAADFVLDKFLPAERSDLPEIIREASAMISEFIYSGHLPNDTRKLL